jgi:hypothetical protein
MTGTPLEAKSLFAGLFDFGFTTFITLKFLRVIYGLFMILILLLGLVFFFQLASLGGGFVLVALVIVPFATLLYLILARISMELIALFFRIGENTSILVAQAGGRPSEVEGGSAPRLPGSAPGEPPTGYGYGPPAQV